MTDQPTTRAERFDLVYGYFVPDGPYAGKRFRLTRSLTVTLPSGLKLAIPASENEYFETDFASIPWLFRRIWPPIGRYTRAAIVHDWMCGSGNYTAQYCDEVFAHLMRLDGVSCATVRAMHRGLRVASALRLRTKHGCTRRWWLTP